MRNHMFLALAALLLTGTQAYAQSDAPAENATAEDHAQVARIVRSDMTKEPIALQTPIVTFKVEGADEGATVRIYGAMHIGGKDYYQTLSRRLGEHEVCLYELVAEKGARPQRRRNDGSPLGLLQQLMADGLGLVHQMQEVDYNRENFVHADLSPEEMKEDMAKRGEDMFTLALGVLLDSQRAENRRAYRQRQRGVEAQQPNQEQTLEGLLQVLQRPGGALTLRRAFAEGLAQNEETMREGTLSRNLIEGRNDAVCDELARQIAAGKKDIAIFYGSGHIPDFVERLEERFNLKPVTTEWLTAIDLTTAPEGAPLELAMDRLMQQMTEDLLKDALGDAPPEFLDLLQGILDEADRR